MDPHAAHDAHGEPVQEFRMDYSEWNSNNIIPAVLFFGFLAIAVSIFIM